MRSPLVRWLSFRVRAVCVVLFAIASFLPPYVPKSAQAFDDSSPSSQQFLFVEEGFLLKSSSVGEQGSRLAYGEGLIHTVKDGESAETIAKRYDISVNTIRWANDLSGDSTLAPGQQLVILPVDGVMHTVKKGQTIQRIAQIYGVSADDIARQNKVRNALIVTGQQLIIPGGKPQAGETPAIAAGDLRFGERLTGTDLRLSLPKGSDGKPATGAGPAAGAQITQTVLQMPCEDCVITQYFNASHFAIDIQEKGGGRVFAAEDGVVIRADTGWNGGYGNVIEIDHGNGLVTLYGHNKSLLVKDGDHVKRGQNIAMEGNTGLVHGPTGIHIHFEVRVNGVKKNPMLYLE
jgi:murein DD-endopeptidase MepM/ murein hydrolase activator NlpD